jgi:DNA repair photolyase
MPMSKQKGQMYDWVTHMHSHLRGQCPHECDYCYTQHMRCARFYQGELKLNEKELKQNYGDGNIVFIEHMNDLFAEDVPEDFVRKILEHCGRYPRNQYVFQTKNPYRPFDMVANYDNYYYSRFEYDRHDHRNKL